MVRAGTGLRHAWQLMGAQVEYQDFCILAIAKLQQLLLAHLNAIALSL